MGGLGAEGIGNGMQNKIFLKKNKRKENIPPEQAYIKTYHKCVNSIKKTLYILKMILNILISLFFFFKKSDPCM